MKPWCMCNQHQSYAVMHALPVVGTSNQFRKWWLQRDVLIRRLAGLGNPINNSIHQFAGVRQGLRNRQR